MNAEKKLYSRREAADALGMSMDSFERYVQPFVPVVMVGRLVRVAPAVLDAWISENSCTVRPARSTTFARGF